MATTNPPSRYIEGLVVREFSPLSSNWRADETAQQFLTKSGVPVISGIDTRRLVRHLRSRGVMRGVLVGPDLAPDRTRKRWSNAHAIRRPWRASISPRASPRRIVTTGTRPSSRCSPSDLEGDRRRDPLPRRRLRFRHQAQHPAPAGAGRLPRHGGSGRHVRRRCARAEARRRVSLERPRRSRAARLPGRSKCAN